MTDAILVVLVVAIAGSMAGVVHLARAQQISTHGVRALALLCGAALVLMLVSDWPSELLAQFWADHSVVAGLLSTVLLVGIVFLAFEDSERRYQQRLDSSVTATGLGGIVDHVVDVEVALALFTADRNPSQEGWSSWSTEGKPLRWLRQNRQRLARGSEGAPTELDPRAHPPRKAPDHEAWRSDLLDQCVRRLLAAIRDWSPVIRGSRNGDMILIAVSELRQDLMRLINAVESDEETYTDLLRSLRQRTRLLAYFFESMSGASPHRPEVLASLQPLPEWSSSRSWLTAETGRTSFDPTWSAGIDHTSEVLGGHR